MRPVEGATREQIDACMHMLRHLDDPMALRRNPLVAPLFRRARSQRSPRRALAEQTQRLRSVLESSVEALRSDEAAGEVDVRDRQYQILRRCDLQREDRETVMRDLGISRRQFYRDRAVACEYVARYVAEHLCGAERAPVFVVDAFEAEHERASTLRFAGEAERAKFALREMVTHAGSARKKVLPWLSLIDMLIDDSRGEEAARELDSLQSFTRSHVSPAAEQLRQLVSLQQAPVLWALGEQRKALDADDATRGELHRLARSTDPGILAVVVKSQISRAAQGFLVGKYAAAREYMTLAGELIDRCDRLPTAHRLEYLLHDGDRKIVAPSDINEMLAPLGEVARIAQSYGNIEYLSAALGGMALLSATFGDLESAARYGREGLAIAQRTARGVRGRMLLICAEIAVECGRPRDSIESAKQARACFPEHGSGATLCWFNIARALIALRDYKGAREAAETLREKAARGDNPRMLGTGLRLLAQAYHGLGEVAKAREHIAAAILVLEQFGHPLSLRAAYLNSATITGQAEHRRKASEIAASLGRTA